MKKILTIIIVIVFLSQSSGLSAKRYPLYADKALRPMALRLSGVHEMVQARKNGLRMAVGLPVKESEKVSILFPKTSPALQFQISVTENPDNPILTPDFQKEAFVLNFGAIKISGTYYLAVRSSTRHNHSRIFLATSKDGYNFKREPGFFMKFLV